MRSVKCSKVEDGKPNWNQANIKHDLIARTSAPVPEPRVRPAGVWRQGCDGPSWQQGEGVTWKAHAKNQRQWLCAFWRATFCRRGIHVCYVWECRVPPSRTSQTAGTQLSPASRGTPLFKAFKMRDLFSRCQLGLAAPYPIAKFRGTVTSISMSGPEGCCYSGNPGASSRAHTQTHTRTHTSTCTQAHQRSRAGGAALLLPHQLESVGEQMVATRTAD